MLQNDVLLRDEKLTELLQDLFPTSSEDEKDGKILTFTRAYHSYKTKYVRHLSFDPDEENLSKGISIYKCFK